jgi:glycosyltransferase involved in cell wall biosynthesis
MPAAPCRLTVAVCTRNRAASLARVLASLAAMAPPGMPFEVLVIDNASTDATPRVLADFAARLPLRSAAEPRPGLSHARNRAVALAGGAWIAWTDDDVVVGRGWLAAYARAAACRPGAALFGGPVAPVLLPPVAPWLRDNLGQLAHPFGLRAFGPAELPLSAAEGRLPFGANFAIRAEVQRRFAYDPGLGAGPLERLAEETAVFEAMFAAGGSGWWVPEAAVEHMIAPERQTIAYIRRYFAAAGATAAYREGDAGPRLFGVPRWLWRRAAGAALRYRLARCAAPPSIWLRHLIVLAQAEGAIRYWRETGKRPARLARGAGLSRRR